MKQPKSPRGAMRIRTLTIGCMLPRMMMETNSGMRTPNIIGSERRTKTNATESRSESSQHRNVCSIPSNRREACTVTRKTARNQIGWTPCSLVMRIENWI